MDFSLTDEQEMFRQMVHDWVEKEAPKNLARDWEAHEFEYPTELWDKMSEAGFHAIGLPEESAAGWRHDHPDDPRPRARPLAGRADLDLGHLVVLRQVGRQVRHR